MYTYTVYIYIHIHTDIFSLPVLASAESVASAPPQQRSLQCRSSRPTEDSPVISRGYGKPLGKPFRKMGRPRKTIEENGRYILW